MARPSIWQDKFDRERAFSVNHPFTCAGKKFAAGDMFDKTLVTTRRLRQLYDKRLLLMCPVQSADMLASDGTITVPLTDWAQLPWLAMRKFVAEQTGIWPSNKLQATELMEAKLGQSA